MASRDASLLAKTIFLANQWQVEKYCTFLFATTILLLCGSLIGSVEEVWGRGGREGGGGAWELTGQTVTPPNHVHW